MTRRPPLRLVSKYIRQPRRGLSDRRSPFLYNPRHQQMNVLFVRNSSVAISMVFFCRLAGRSGRFIIVPVFCKGRNARTFHREIGSRRTLGAQEPNR